MGTLHGRVLEMILVLPYPVSVNSAYSTNFKTKRRFKSLRYSNWLAEAQVCLMKQCPQPVHGLIKVEYVYGRPDKRRRDIGNGEKVVSDFLVSADLIDDDSCIQEIILRWGTTPGVVITVEPWEEADAQTR